MDHSVLHLTGADLRRIRRAADLTLADLAAESGVSISTLSNFETAKRPLRIEHALRVLKVLMP